MYMNHGDYEIQIEAYNDGREQRFNWSLFNAAGDCVASDDEFTQDAAIEAAQKAAALDVNNSANAALTYTEFFGKDFDLGFDISKIKNVVDETRRNDDSPNFILDGRFVLWADNGVYDDALFSHRYAIVTWSLVEGTEDEYQHGEIVFLSNDPAELIAWINTNTNQEG